jgi:hypothetical protein
MVRSRSVHHKGGNVMTAATTTRSAKKLSLRRSLALVAGLALVALTFCAGRASAVPQPSMESALGHLEQAKVALERAEHNKGGFRAKALQLTSEAILAVREGIAVGNK